MIDDVTVGMMRQDDMLMITVSYTKSPLNTALMPFLLLLLLLLLLLVLPMLLLLLLLLFLSGSHIKLHIHQIRTVCK